MSQLSSRIKAYTRDQDKICSPAATVARARELFNRFGEGILAQTRRIDTGRLGIPVFLSVCGDMARHVMPTRKQMGKGASVDQAEASALMELAERFSFFDFLARRDGFIKATWSEAEKLSALPLVGLVEIAKSVQEDLDEKTVREIMDLARWDFCSALCVSEGKDLLLPLTWFKKLNEFNGSSAGNCPEESILQGACELVERHVSALIDADHRILPTIDPASCRDEVLRELLAAFERCGIKVWLKDFSLGLPAPTVGALAYDPASFPGLSEIVFTAGTASSPAKAAIRALTEVAQLAGDFETGSNYEASGLSKFTNLSEIEWLTQGGLCELASLPRFERDDILEELNALCAGLGKQDYKLYSLDTTHPELQISTNYNIVPGFKFRERSRHASLGLFVGRVLAEEAPFDEAFAGLAKLEEIYPKAHFLPFFEAMLALRLEDYESARQGFAKAEEVQPDDEDRALSAFYQGHSLTLAGEWAASLPHLDRAIGLCGEVKEYFNLRGVAKFKQGIYAEAARDFESVLNLDKGSAMDIANLGLCHKFMGNKDEAVHYLSSALELDPGLEFAREHLKMLSADE